MNDANEHDSLLRDVQRFKDVHTIYKVIGIVAGWSIGLICGGFVIASGVMS